MSLDCAKGLFGQFSVLAKLKFMRFLAMIVLSFKKIILMCLQKLKSLDLLMTQDSSLGKVSGKTFSEAKCTGLLLERLPLNVSSAFALKHSE